MSNNILPSLLAVLTGALLSNCSHPAPTTTSEATEKENRNSAAKFPYGGKVDSLNGVPTHRFGEPLSAFKGLVKVGSTTPGMVTYYLPTGSAQQVRWFAKHNDEVPGVFYLFRDGKFASFQAVSYSAVGQAALAAEARFLFGPGRSLGDRTEWVGTQAWATLSSTYINGQNAKFLNINSITLQNEQEIKQQVQLKAENSQ